MPATCRITWKTNSPAASEDGGFWQPTPPLAWLSQRRPPQLEPECRILDLSSGMDKCMCRSPLLSPAGSDTENGSKRKRSRLRNDWWGKRRNTAGGPLRMHPFLKGKWTLEPAQRIIWNCPLWSVKMGKKMDLISKLCIKSHTVQEKLWPNQAAITHSGEHQSSHHPQDALAPVPAQHHNSQKQHGCWLNACYGDGCWEIRGQQIEVQRWGQKEGQERKKQGARLSQREEKKQTDTLKKLVNEEILSVSSRKRTVPYFSFGACHRHVYRGCPLSQHRPGSSRCLQIRLSPVFLWLCLYPFTARWPCKYGMILKVFALFGISRLYWTLDWSSLYYYALIISDLSVLRLCTDLKPLQLNYDGDINTQGAKLTTVKCDGTLFARFKLSNIWPTNAQKS